jgi:hypothetical protein
MTIDNVTAGELIDPEWGNAVADQLNNLPEAVIAGATTASTDGSGNLAITFGDTFASAPRITVTPASTNCSQGYILSVSTTGAVFRCFSAAGATVASASVTVQWIAFGELA